ncbi:hypothetical protein A9404_04535 [Halothiobacillus diazotrophicus]|uniref:Uncharacterized protein n=1 Tax=Halothiobacillus diazotrophicus TaxID=1860122 RepID=A0A191ZFV6_9GAMM|nr:hypothetical protein A9404_04535 [Halothiobacillus diazotrophicus]
MALLTTALPILSSAATQRLPALPLEQTSDAPTAPEPTREAGTCANHRFVKTVALSRVWIPSAPADILNLGSGLSEAVATDLNREFGFRTTLVPATRARDNAPAIGTFTRTGQIYFIRISGHDFLATGHDSAWSFLGPSADPRSGTIDISIDNGAKGIEVAHTEIAAESVRIAPYQPPIDARGRPFWSSTYGQSLQQLAEHAARFIGQSLDCEPLTGQVIRVDGREITINRGADDGLRLSDRPLLLRRSDPVSLLGQETLPERHTLESLGAADIVHLSHHTAMLRYPGNHIVQIGDLVQAGE